MNIGYPFQESSLSIDLARQLRKNMPIPEAKLWSALRSLRPQGHHFRRQVEIGRRYYVDFCCHASGLIIEVDGDTHFVGNAPERDQARDAFLNSEGYRVLRVPNGEVMRNLDGVMILVLEALAVGPAPPSP
jgi:very-short-patch-repair endonuclease